MLEWAIRNEKQLRAKQNLHVRGECYDLHTMSGFQCKCKPGYRGNPYLHDSCQGITPYIVYICFNFAYDHCNYGVLNILPLDLQTLMSVSSQVSIIAQEQKIVSTQKGVINVIVQSGFMGTEEKMVKVVLKIPYHCFRLS